MAARTIATTVAAAAALALGAGAAPADAAGVVARYEMNEPPGATVLHDSSGAHRDGRIGGEVTTGVALKGGGTGYRFAFLPPKQPPPHPGHLVQVPDSPAIDPGTRDYAITVRFRTTSMEGNLIQKGQSGGVGGFVKLEVHKGLLSCLFRGATGSTSVKTASRVDDGAWHTVRCSRTVDTLVMTVDGSVRTGHGPTGRISNTSPLTIAGKLRCNEVDVGCDYFAGDIDRVQIDG